MHARIDTTGEIPYVEVSWYDAGRGGVARYSEPFNTSTLELDGPYSGPLPPLVVDPDSRPGRMMNPCRRALNLWCEWGRPARADFTFPVPWAYRRDAGRGWVPAEAEAVRGPR